MSIVRFNPYFADRRPAPAGWVPAADIWETPDSYRIDLEIQPDSIPTTLLPGRILASQVCSAGLTGSKPSIFLTRRKKGPPRS